VSKKKGAKPTENTWIVLTSPFWIRKNKYKIMALPTYRMKEASIKSPDI
tara:strand:+ start:1096 stop:1242 length:147 start_codon:yes stop_codon:yes gene_type:complete